MAKGMTKGLQVLLKLVGDSDANDVRLISLAPGGAWFEGEPDLVFQICEMNEQDLPLFVGNPPAVFVPSQRIEWMLAAESTLGNVGQ